MTITEDALRILVFIYHKRITSSEVIIAQNGWERFRIREAVRFLEGEGLIEKPIYTIDGGVLRLRLSSAGIKRIENQKDFQANYNVTINLTANIDSIFKTDAIFKASVL